MESPYDGGNNTLTRHCMIPHTSPRVDYTSLCHQQKGSHRPLISEATAYAIGYPPQIESKTPLLKTLQNYSLEQGEVYQVLSWKHHQYWLVFTVLEGVIHATGEKRDHQSQPVTSSESCNSDLPVRQAHWHNSGTDSMVVTTTFD